MEKILPLFVHKKNVVFKVINTCVYKMCSNFAVFISMRRINCHVICLLNYSCHFIWMETYISNITSFRSLSVFMFTNIKILLSFFV